MKRLLAFPLVWALLLLMWLALSRAPGLADVVFGALVAFAATLALRALEAPQVTLRRPRAVCELACVVLVDVVRSNIAVAQVVLHRGTRRRTSGFVQIPLELRNPAGLAVLACIVTATPGTAWAGYDSRRGVLTLHVLDLVDEAASIRGIEDRYERRLLEIFQ